MGLTTDTAIFEYGRILLGNLSLLSHVFDMPPEVRRIFAAILESLQL